MLLFRRRCSGCYSSWIQRVRLGLPHNGCKCKFVPHWLRRADLEVVLEEDSARQRRHCVVVAVVVGATCVSHKCGGETRSELVFLVLNTECIPASRLTA